MFMPDLSNWAQRKKTGTGLSSFRFFEYSVAAPDIRAACGFASRRHAAFLPRSSVMPAAVQLETAGGVGLMRL